MYCFGASDEIVSLVYASHWTWHQIVRRQAKLSCYGCRGFDKTSLASFASQFARLASTTELERTIRHRLGEGTGRGGTRISSCRFEWTPRYVEAPGVHQTS